MKRHLPGLDALGQCEQFFCCSSIVHLYVGCQLTWMICTIAIKWLLCCFQMSLISNSAAAPGQEDRMLTKVDRSFLISYDTEKYTDLLLLS